MLAHLPGWVVIVMLLVATIMPPLTSAFNARQGVEHDPPLEPLHRCPPGRFRGNQ